MDRPRQKDTVKGVAEVIAEPKRAYHVKKEPMRFKLKKARIVSLDENLKRIYRTTN